MITILLNCNTGDTHLAALKTGAGAAADRRGGGLPARHSLLSSRSQTLTVPIVASNLWLLLTQALERRQTAAAVACLRTQLAGLTPPGCAPRLHQLASCLLAGSTTDLHEVAGWPPGGSVPAARQALLTVLQVSTDIVTQASLNSKQHMCSRETHRPEGGCAAVSFVLAAHVRVLSAMCEGHSAASGVAPSATAETVACTESHPSPLCTGHCAANADGAGAAAGGAVEAVTAKRAIVCRSQSPSSILRTSCRRR